MKKKTVLIVEDDEHIQQLVGYNLIKAGFLVEYGDSGEQALEKIENQTPDLVLLDLMLPGMDGKELCRILRSDCQLTDLPIIMLTAKDEESDIIAGLDLGADDYITKPFSPKVLISRVKAVLRRKAKESAPLAHDSSGVIKIYDLVIDPGRYEVKISEESISLTPTEFGILKLLAKRPGWVFSRQQIIDAVRGYDYLVTPRTIDVQMFSLRKKLGDTGKKIETVRGIGYRFNDSA
ncbi:MAG: ArsR family transcriptional regulator [Desulfobacterales bacterium SG8_35_2]|nr:MAG: ArsR family transcriptional regulator [Desulfobacterales bacterium SG8_35_2]